MKTLPYLTYISVFNYRAGRQGEIFEYQDDSMVIKAAKEYGTIPLLAIATLSSRGEPDLEAAYDLFLNEEYLERNINSTINILRTKGYSGVNMIFSHMNPTNQELYKDLITKVSTALRAEGFLYFITVNPVSTDIAQIQGFDFTSVVSLVDSITMMRFVWGTLTDPPGPVNNNLFLTDYLNYFLNYFPSDKMTIGIPVFGYEWELPYRSGITRANSLTNDSAISLAYGVGSDIVFSEELQRPYFEYSKYSFGVPAQFVVWFNDARSVNSIITIGEEYQLEGLAVWNIMVFFAQLWLIINSQYNIVKLLPDQLE